MKMHLSLASASVTFAILAFLTLSLNATAQESINCLEWTYRAESQFVTERAADRIAGDIVSESKRLGFFVQSVSNGVDAELGDVRSYALKYDRDLVVNRPALLKKYNEFVQNLAWHLNSRLGHAFYCSFWAPDPHPRLSGSN